jgi:hypothetical protein
LTSSPFFHHYLPAHERLAVRTRLRKDLADSRWKTVGNGNQNLIRTKAATPETTRNFEFRIFFLNIYLFFSLALTYRYITDVMMCIGPDTLECRLSFLNFQLI